MNMFLTLLRGGVLGLALGLLAAAVILGTRSGVQSAPVQIFTPAYFCPAGQHLASPNSPACKPSPKPLRTLPLSDLTPRNSQ